MSETRKEKENENLSPEQPAEQSLVPEQERQEAEMPEDFVEPEGKAGKWKTVKGEVEMEGKKVEVTYREKVIELPRHRQQETGIKRIRRRELLPPFPEGLYLSPEDREKLHTAEWERSFKEPYPEERKKEFESGEVAFFSAYSSDKKFGQFYSFFTDGKYPSSDIYAHTINYILGAHQHSTADHPKSQQEMLFEEFKRENIYFQEVANLDEQTDSGDYSYIHLQKGKIYGNYDDSYSTPVFIFSEKNKFLLARSLNETDLRCYKGEYHLSPNYSPDGKKIENLRWCNADLALIPTKRSLNVLFFETGDEDKQKSKKEE